MVICGKEECVFEAVNKMIKTMKDEVAKQQNIAYPEQIKVAEIYDVVASCLAEACRRKNKIQLKNCEEAKNHRKVDVSMDVFILLSRLKEDGFITEECEKTLFEALIEMKPEMKEQIESDRAKGLI